MTRQMSLLPSPPFAKAASLPFQRSEDYYGITIDRLHAALTEPQP